MHNNTEPASAWGAVPVPDDVIDEVTSEAAGANQGPIVPGINSLQARTGWLRDAHKGVRTMKALSVAPNDTEGTPTAAPDGIQIDFDNTRFIGMSIEITEPVIRVFGSANNTRVEDSGVSTTDGTAVGRLDAKKLSFTGVTAAATTASVNNTLTPETLPKGWINVFVSTSGGVTTVTVNAGINIASAAMVTVSGVKYLRITWTTAMANFNYGIAWEPRVVGSGPSIYLPATTAKTSDHVDVSVIDLTTSPASRTDLGADGGWTIAGTLFGRQT